MNSFTLKITILFITQTKLTNNIISHKESLRFIKTVQDLKKIKKGQLTKLNIEVSKRYLKKNNKIGIF